MGEGERESVRGERRGRRGGEKRRRRRNEEGKKRKKRRRASVGRVFFSNPRQMRLSDKNKKEKRTTRGLVPAKNHTSGRGLPCPSSAMARRLFYGAEAAAFPGGARWHGEGSSDDDNDARL